MRVEVIEHQSKGFEVLPKRWMSNAPLLGSIDFNA